MKTAQAAPTGSAIDGRTRGRVARLLLEHGPSTAASLGESLGLSPAAVRRHLEAMLADGTITAREARPSTGRGRGRPARLYVLTDAGHAAGPTAYEDLASGALRFMLETGGTQALAAFAHNRAADLESRISETTGSASHEDKPRAVADAMSANGYAASVSEVPTGVQICQHHCPVQVVAEQFPQLCEAETEALSRLLGSHVQRLATIAHGDGVCTTHIPNTPATSSEGRSA